jgi:hypothetical protein
MKYSTSLLIVLILAMGGMAQAQKDRPVIKSNVQLIKWADGDEIKGWKIEPDIDPDSVDVVVAEGKKSVKFMTDIDSLVLSVEAGKQYDFYIEFNGKKCHIRVNGIKP